jgi:hypothetical protein
MAEGVKTEDSGIASYLQQAAKSVLELAPVWVIKKLDLEFDDEPALVPSDPTVQYDRANHQGATVKKGVAVESGAGGGMNSNTLLLLAVAGLVFYFVNRR